MKAQVPSADLLIRATGCSSVAEALTWIAEGHPLEQDVNLHEVLRAIVIQIRSGTEATAALRRIARNVASSDLDSAEILFAPEMIVPADRLRDTLNKLAAHCQGGTLANITASAVIAAQRFDSFTLEILGALAGLSYPELRERVGDLPPTASGPFRPSQIRRAFATVDTIVRGKLSTTLSGAVPARPLELMPKIGIGRSGWQVIEELRTGGVPYEILLAQRLAGGAWLAHRNRTSSKLAPLLADRVCEELDVQRLKYRRSTRVGGKTLPSRLSELSGCDQQLGLVVLDSEHRPAFGVIFATARDSGTASKSVSRLVAMKRPPNFPIAIVVAGPGWAARNETACLAAEFDGRLYSERAIAELTKEIIRTTR